MDNQRTLTNSIRLLNEFCADREMFSTKALTFLKLQKLKLYVDDEQQILTIAISTDKDYQVLRTHLVTKKRLYQLLTIHFKLVRIVFGLLDELLENMVHLETIKLSATNINEITDLRDPESLGARLRRALNIVLQGHTVILWLYQNNDVKHFNKLWKRERILKLLKDYNILYNYDVNNQLVKLWRGNQEAASQSKNIIITIR
ncbi:MAG: hypothetical protein KAH84_06590 [Thiomargarita sp.]|nr:hypothetical protein [Thiomargarita sp.]